MAISQQSLKAAFKSLLPDVVTAVRRFPLAVVISVMFTALHVLDLREPLGFDRDGWVRLSFSFVGAFFFSMAMTLFGERAGWPVVKRLVVQAAGIAVLALLSVFSGVLGYEVYLLVFALAVFVGLAPFVTSGEANNAAFWQFNHHLWLGAGLALVGAALFAGGISLIMETLEQLFGLKFPRDLHADIWTIGLGLVAPLNWLSLAPADFDEEVVQGEQTEFTSRAVAVIVKFILVPLLLVYTAILYAYAVKIGIDAVLPKGRVGPMVLAYGLLGAVTILFAWPSRKASGPLVAVFWRHWFWLTIVPVALLFLAAYQRIDQYGVTHERYMVVLAGLWLAGLALWFLIQRSGRDLRVVPLSLAVLLALASAGPWGLLDFSVRSQVSELAGILEANGRLKGGRIDVNAGASGLSGADARRVSSILRYLRRHDRLPDLADWFEPGPGSPFAPEQSQRDTEQKLAAAIGLPKGAGLLARRFVNFTANQPVDLQLGDFRTAVGPFNLNSTRKSQDVLLDDGTQMTITLDDGAISLRRTGAADITFDIGDTFRKLAELPTAKASDKIRKPLFVEADNGDGRLVIRHLSGRAANETRSITRLEGWIYLKP